MHKTHIFLSIIVIILLIGCTGNAVVQENQVAQTNVPASLEPTILPEVVSNNQPLNCQMTVPQNPAFVPPAPYDSLNSFNDHFWFGSSALWTLIPSNGEWNALPHSPEGYIQKILWWRDGYVWDHEPEPNLIVNGERMDESAPPLIVSKAANAFASDIGSAMMVGVDFPTLGCWKITGKYNDAELSFVIWVAP
jgi:hypothetical protein